MRKAIAIAIVACLCVPAIALADVSVKIPTIELIESPVEQTGEFYIYVEHNEASDPLLNSFDLRLEVGDPGVALPDSAKPEAGDMREYVLPSGLGYTPGGSDSAPTMSDVVLTLPFLDPGFDPMVSGRAFAKVQFSVAGGLAPGVYPILLDEGFSELNIFANEGDTSPETWKFDGLRLASVPGAIVIQQIPEPATTVMLLSMVASLGFWFWRRRSAA